MAMGTAPIQLSCQRTIHSGKQEKSGVKKKLTTKPAKAIPPLHGRGEAAADTALHGAHARPVSADLAGAGRNTGVGGTASVAGGGGGSGGRGRGAGALVGRGRVARDGGPGAVAVLLDRGRLELRVRLVGRWVDAEDHAAAAVGALAAVEPCWGGWLVSAVVVGLGWDERGLAYRAACRP